MSRRTMTRKKMTAFRAVTNCAFLAGQAVIALKLWPNTLNVAARQAAHLRPMTQPLAVTSPAIRAALAVIHPKTSSSIRNASFLPNPK